MDRSFLFSQDIKILRSSPDSQPKHLSTILNSDISKCKFVKRDIIKDIDFNFSYFTELFKVKHKSLLISS